MRGKAVPAVIMFLMIVIFQVQASDSYGERKGEPAYRDGVVLVKFRPGSNERDRGRARSLVRALHTERYRYLDVERLSLGPGVSEVEAVRFLREDPGVEYAELDWRVKYLAMPRMEPADPYFPDQWYLDAPPLQGYFATKSRHVSVDRDIDAPEAWAVMGAVLTTSMSGAVGVIDSGCGEFGYFDPANGYIPDHEDLPNGSLWANTIELVTPGEDDEDANTLVDDVNGWDFMDGDNVPADDYDPEAPYHGTFISGIIAAEWGNGKGGAGIGADRLKVLPFRAYYLDDILGSIDYAINTKSGSPPVRVLNASWSYDQPIEVLQDAIETAGAAGIAFVAAAGNDGLDNDVDNGIFQAYPADYTKVPLENVLAVAASNSAGSLAYFSNYGPDAVQIAAPGQDMVSAYGGTDEYGIGNGTSFAAPVAASALALIMSANPGLAPAEAIDRLIDGGEFDARLSGLVRSGKRVNLAGALAPFAPYSGYAPVDTRQPLSLYDDTVSAMYGSIVSAISDSPSVAVMVTLPGGAWAVSPVSPGLATFTLEFGGASAPVGTYETGLWRVTAISPFFAQLEERHGETVTFSSLVPSANVSWSVADPSVGTIDADGVFTALNYGINRVFLSIDGQDVDNSGIVLVLPIDDDGDGYRRNLDCDDTNPYVNPAVNEICTDGIDNDCDGDVDGDDSECRSGGGGGACGTTAPSPDGPVWPGMVMTAVLACIVLLARKRQMVMAGDEGKDKRLKGKS